jgi:hypothetical protein
VQRRATDYLPNLFEIFRKRHLAAIRHFDARIPAEYLQRGADAREDEIGAAHPLPLQPRHPLTDAIWQFAQYVGPITDRRILLAWATHQVDTGT